MTSVAPAPLAPVLGDWTVRVEIEFGPTPGHPDPEWDLLLAMLTRTDHPHAAVVVLPEVVHVTWAPPAWDGLDAGQALVAGVDSAIGLVTGHAGSLRVREASVEPTRTVPSQG